MRVGIKRTPWTGRRAMWATALAAGALLLAGCSNIATPSPSPQPSDSPVPAMATPTHAATPGPASTSTPTPESTPAPTATVEHSPAATPTGDDVAESYQRRSPFVPLYNPEFIAPEQATFLTPDDRVLGLTINGESRAYPLRMMTYHHIANDTIAGRPVLVTF